VAVSIAVVAAAAGEIADSLTRICEADMTSKTHTLPKSVRAIAVAALVCASAFAAAQASAQQRFKSPEEAVNALVAAVRSDSSRQVTSVLGRDAWEIIESGDEVADATAMAAFLTAYDIRHQIVSEGSERSILVVGNNDWPLPIPIVQDNGSWRFDTAAGKEEVLYRRIGGNELNAIRVCLAYVAAQNEYADMNPQGSKVDNYAQRIVSSPGKKDGLYWPSGANESASPLGEAMAAATLQGYRFTGTPAPYHGYYYKILTAQGPTAPGGAVNYVVNGQMIGGFALVAYPAEYGNSGVMTFLVNHTGTIFQKDLGPRTSRIASRMTAYSPDHTWKKVSEPSTQGAAQ
jgi:hypothetical protein